MTDYIWRVEARYADGRTFCRLFAYDNCRTESDQQYELEAFAIGRHENCVWYSVDLEWIGD